VKIVQSRQREASCGDEKMSSDQEKRRAPVRVLVVDDHALVREGTRRLLEQQPDIVVAGEAGDGEEALRLAESLQPDIVLMDVAMPRLNGVVATRRLKQRFPDMAVLVLSGYDDDAYVFALIEAGAAGYLLKNASSQDLIRAIHAVCEGEAVLHPAIARKVMLRLHSSGQHRAGVPNREQLSEREVEILRFAALGLDNQEIATQLSLSRRTIQSHLNHIFGKLGVASRTEAVVAALRSGSLRLDELVPDEQQNGRSDRQRVQS